MSTEPPGANGTIILIGLSGYLSAGDCAIPACPKSKVTAAARTAAVNPWPTNLTKKLLIFFPPPGVGYIAGCSEIPTIDALSQHRLYTGAPLSVFRNSSDDLTSTSFPRVAAYCFPDAERGFQFRIRQGRARC
jgi:hypothetical protein